MEILHRRCAGLDVHKKSVVTTILVSDEHGRVLKETRSFGNLPNEILKDTSLVIIIQPARVITLGYECLSCIAEFRSIGNDFI